jgi:phosphoribosylanthranilate isomerase
MWVKICGNTNLEDAEHAAVAGADALGFVFASSPRQVTLEQVRRIVLPHSVETYGVFVDTPLNEIVRTVLECGLSGVQLHCAIEPRIAHTLRRHFLARHVEHTKIVSVLAYDETLPRQLIEAAASADAVLVDSKSATSAGGTGKRWNWQAASGTFRDAIGKVRIIAAGGLDPANVEKAIHTLAPWGVDVVSGVEASPGRKDRHLVEAFIQSAKGRAPVTAG